MNRFTTFLAVIFFILSFSVPTFASDTMSKDCYVNQVDQNMKMMLETFIQFKQELQHQGPSSMKVTA